MKKIILILIYTGTLFTMNAEPILDHYKTHKISEEKILDFEISIYIGGFLLDLTDPERQITQNELYEMDNIELAERLMQNLNAININGRPSSIYNRATIIQLAESDYGITQYWQRIYMMSWSYIIGKTRLTEKQSAIFFRIIQLAEKYIDQNRQEQIIVLLKQNYLKENLQSYIAEYGIDMEFLKTLK